MRSYQGCKRLPEEILIDVALLEAPLPLQLSLKGASELQESQYIKMIHRMRPCHLFSFLEKMDTWWTDFEVSDSEYLVFIAKADDSVVIEYLKGKIADEYGRIIA